MVNALPVTTTAVDDAGPRSGIGNDESGGGAGRGRARRARGADGGGRKTPRCPPVAIATWLPLGCRM